MIKNRYFTTQLSTLVTITKHRSQQRLRQNRYVLTQTLYINQPVSLGCKVQLWSKPLFYNPTQHAYHAGYYHQAPFSTAFETKSICTYSNFIHINQPVSLGCKVQLWSKPLFYNPTFTTQLSTLITLVTITKHRSQLRLRQNWYVLTQI